MYRKITLTLLFFFINYTYEWVGAVDFFLQVIIHNIKLRNYFKMLIVKKMWQIIAFYMLNFKCAYRNCKN